MNPQSKPPRELAIACRRQGIVPTRFALDVSIAKQRVSLFERIPAQSSEARFPEFELVKTYRCSTSRYGIGEVAGSNMTPRGLHRIAKKFGGGWPIGAVFKSRDFTGYTWDGQPGAPITHRIFWLEGLEPGFNRGGNVDSFARFIYVHGTGCEPGIGRPASHGCVHLSANDLLPLYDKLPVGTMVWISS